MQAGFRGAIFDVDGVLVDSPHEQAWRSTLQELMETRWSELPGGEYAPERFTSDVYRAVVSGRPRLSGARAVLEHFHVPDAGARAAVYAERKQQRVAELIEAGEFAAFQDALRFVLAVSGRGLRLAAASSSKNARPMLEQLHVDATDRRLRDVFAADLSGRDVAHGKPEPDIFLAAAEALGLAPEQCFVVEDAVVGVEAAKAGGMAALGVARADDVGLLTAAGADLVVATLDEVDLDRIDEGRLAIRRPRPARHPA